jgi:hypothetical protein
VDTAQYTLAHLAPQEKGIFSSKHSEGIRD